jgi:phosphate transport system permease protein
VLKFNRRQWQRFKDGVLQFFTFTLSSVTLITLSAIVLFVFQTGAPLLNVDLFNYDYTSNTYISEPILVNGNVEFCNCAPTRTLDEGVNYSEKWGIGLSDDEDVLGKPVVIIEYIHQNSPLVLLKNKGVGPETFRLLDEYYVRRIAFFDQPSALDIYGSQSMIDMLDANDTFRELEVITKGGGIRGSVITTLWLILLTLIMALPIGIAAAIYLNEYVSKNSVIARYLRQFIELLTGVPSIIYGLMGLAFFAPFIANISQATGPSILSGAMTLAVIVLPLIIRTTEESLKVVPNEYRQAAFALGASKTQTVFKTVIPSALPGILSATLLAIGRIVGESAALIFAIGVIIKDEISIFGQSTSLAVHIYAMMTDEPANIELSATISLIILAIVLFLNIAIKLLTRRMINKRLPGGMI